MFRNIIILLVVAFGANAQSNFNYKRDYNTIVAKTKISGDKLNYDKLLLRFKANDNTLTDAEVLALLIGFSARPEYMPYEDLLVEHDIYNLNAEGKYDEALQKANEYLGTHPLSVKAIYEKSFSCFKAGNNDSAKYYVKQGQRIFKAMTYSGNGKTKQTPIFVLGPSDGHDYINKFIEGGIGLTSSIKDDNGNSVDILEVKLKAGESYELYFITQHASVKMINGKDKKKSGK